MGSTSLEQYRKDDVVLADPHLFGPRFVFHGLFTQPRHSLLWKKHHPDVLFRVLCHLHNEWRDIPQLIAQGQDMKPALHTRQQLLHTLLRFRIVRSKVLQWVLRNQFRDLVLPPREDGTPRSQHDPHPWCVRECVHVAEPDARRVGEARDVNGEDGEVFAREPFFACRWTCFGAEEGEKSVHIGLWDTFATREVGNGCGRVLGHGECEWWAGS